MVNSNNNNKNKQDINKDEPIKLGGIEELLKYLKVNKTKNNQVLIFEDFKTPNRIHISSGMCREGKSHFAEQMSKMIDKHLTLDSSKTKFRLHNVKVRPSRYMFNLLEQLRQDDIDTLIKFETKEGEGKTVPNISNEDFKLIEDFRKDNNISEGYGYTNLLLQFVEYCYKQKEIPFSDISHEFRCGVCEVDYLDEADAKECFVKCSMEQCKIQYGGVLPVEKMLINGKVVSEEICK